MKLVARDDKTIPPSGGATDFALQLMNVAFQMMNFVFKNDGFEYKNG